MSSLVIQCGASASSHLGFNWPEKECFLSLKSFKRLLTDSSGVSGSKMVFSVLLFFWGQHTFQALLICLIWQVNLSLNNQTSLHLESFEGSCVEKEFPVVISCINFPSFSGGVLLGRYVPTPDISEIAKESPYLRVMIWQVSLCVGTLECLPVLYCPDMWHSPVPADITVLVLWGKHDVVLQLCELSFNKTRHLRNAYNENLPVKVFLQPLILIWYMMFVDCKIAGVPLSVVY